ncbi:hydrogenase iron-sulfur subunit [Ammonifex thiophilus]|uniref:Hydrogenase iron-sulfur subunit n=2 Tax=Ammonifex thiophilus TaxID=444093 RepID=A0A3D8P4K9_9THEO|nr:hydrogenase iron-sulfur subunit [Ammonifex thiophilus]
MSSFEPRIIGFLCNWCSYAGADLAGVSRIQYPPNIRIIRVMCSGRVDPRFVLKALFSGADGVLVAGCHPGDCHYVKGNYYAHRRFNLTKRLVELFGIEPERVRLEWISAAEGARFGSVVTEFTEQIRALGPIKVDEVPPDWDELGKAASVLGSAGKVFLDESVSMVDIVRYFMEYVQQDSCAECRPCPIGTKYILDILNDLRNGGEMPDPSLVKELARTLKQGSKCGLGRVAGLITEKLWERFYDELEAYRAGQPPKTVAPNPGWQTIAG